MPINLAPNRDFRGQTVTSMRATIGRVEFLYDGPLTARIVVDFFSSAAASSRTGLGRVSAELPLESREYVPSALAYATYFDTLFDTGGRNVNLKDLLVSRAETYLITEESDFAGASIV